MSIIERDLGHNGQDEANKRFLAFSKKIGVFGDPLVAAFFITRGAAYVIDPEFYSERETSIIPRADKTTTQDSDRELEIDTIKHVGFGLVGVGSLIAAREIKSNLRISRRMFFIKAGAVITGFAGGLFTNIFDKRES